MVDFSDWRGLVGGRTDDYAHLELVAVLDSSVHSWASPFRAIASDGNDYFVKTLESCRREWARGSLAIEYVVSQVGGLIGAPVCGSALIRIPEEFRGERISRGVSLVPGIAHASRALERAEEHRDHLAYRSLDHNRIRHVGVYALYDWCYGDDPQWLYDVDADRTIYSHDHGLYLPPNHGVIDAAVLRQAVDEPNVLLDPPDGLDRRAVATVAAALETVEREMLATVLRRVPASWPVSDEALATLGWFLEHRAPATAHRLRALT
ncbi:hypothetical protein Sru01_50730 [Sphaerisporangium rufum]|uniref:Uncharacterized protein n=1 Tax=Sphaerisporangium rufum TaxID=1381558 RepID=A0A919R5J4_9ACTN|nr:hypothetical protein Sru01_50730 [Sphaerisporangium rufum]